MPDNPRLRSAEVGGLHVDAGARALAGTPILTLVHRRREHVVRAPRSGRIVPLVAPGDWVSAGEPLYVLNLDEVALEEANRESRARIAVARRHRQDGATAAPAAAPAPLRAPEPVPSIRAQTPPKAVPDDRKPMERWYKPALALLLYLVACFTFLPILNTLGKDAGPLMLAGLIAACLGFAALIYYLYAPDSGRWQRWTVGTVAASWLVMSGISVLWAPPTGDLDPDAILAEVGELAIGASETEETVESAPPADPTVLASTEVIIERPGVVVMPFTEVPVPDHAPFVADLAGQGDPVTPHGVQVRQGSTFAITRASGTEAALPIEEASPATPVPADVQIAAATPTLAREAFTPPEDAFRTEPGLVDRIASVAVSGRPAVLTNTEARDTALVPGETALVSGPDRKAITLALAETPAPQDAPVPVLDAEAMAMAALPVLLHGEFADVPSAVALGASLRPGDALQDVRHAAAPPTLGETRPPALVLVEELRPSDDIWLSRQIAATDDAATVPTIASVTDGVPQAERSVPATDPVATVLNASVPRLVPSDHPSRTAVAVLASLDLSQETLAGHGTALAAVSRPAQPAALGRVSSPDLILLAAVRAGDENWMIEQTGTLVESRLASADRAVVNQAGLAPAGEADVRRIPLMPSRAPVAPTSREEQPLVAARGKPGAIAVNLTAAAGAPRLSSATMKLGAEDRAAGGTDLRIAALPGPNAPSPLPTVPEVQEAPPEAPVTAETTEGLEAGDGAIRRIVAFLYYDDPRLETHPQLGDPWAPMLSPDLAASITETRVTGVLELLQVQAWCAGNGTTGDIAELSDRFRLLQVDMVIADAQVAALEAQLPIFAGVPAMMFHNRSPLLGGAPGDPVMPQAEAFITGLSNRLMDPNVPEWIEGGQYFTARSALADALGQANCAAVRWNGGAGPENTIGMAMETMLGG